MRAQPGWENRTSSLRPRTTPGLKLKRRRIRGLMTGWLEGGCRETGAPILLLLHGYPDGPRTWDYQVAHYQKDYLILCPFNRGAGPSEKSPTLSRYTEPSAALDLLEILKEVDPSGKRPVVCVGHDIGAVYGWYLAPLLGPRLRALVILNGLSLKQMLGRRGRLRQHLKSWYIYLLQVPRLPDWFARHFPQTLLTLAHHLGELPEDRRLGRKELADCVEGPINQYRAFVRRIPQLLRERAPRLQRPVLVIWGSRDRFLLTPTLEELEPFAADVTTRVVEGNHWVHREKPEVVNRLIDGFLGREGKA